MKFDQITIENFLAISKATVKLSDRGLVLVQGINEDDTSATSNGSGKSSIMDALCWALYGVTARDVTGDAVVERNVAKKGTRVEVKILDGDTTYLVARHRKHSTGKNSLVLSQIRAGAATDLTKGADKLTQIEVEKVIGSSLEVFKGAVYAAQEQMPDLPGMTDKALKVLIEEAAGSTILEEAYREAQDRLAVEKSKMIELSAEGDRIVARIDLQLANIDAAKVSQAAWVTARDQMIATARAEANSIVADLRDAQANLASLRDQSLVQGEVKAIDAKIAGVENEKAQLRKLTDELTAAKNAVARLDANMTSSKKAVTDQKASIDSITLRVGQPCGECGKAYCAEDLHDARSIATDQLRSLADSYKTVAKRHGDAVADAQKLADALETFRAAMTDVSAETSQRASLLVELDEIRAVQGRVDALKIRAGGVAAAIKSKMAEEDPFEKQIATLLEGVAQSRIKQDHNTAARTAQSDEFAVAQAVVQVFSPSGVRALILDDVTPFLNDRTANYLGTLSDGNISATWATLVRNAKGDLREKFSIEVENVNGGDNFKGISGGEKRKVRIATALALQDLVARRATKPIELFIGDEIDDALDDAGLERLTAILEEKARERGSVFVVSHSDLRDWISQIMIVRKKGKVSVIEEVTA